MKASTNDRRFAPDVFFGMAAERLYREPPGTDVLGDHTLNPDPGTWPAEAGYTDAAVLIPVVARSPEVTVILTLRTPHLRAHAGQIAFPGGKLDADDHGPAEAAVREAWEEVGLDPALVEPLGYLDRYLSGTGFRIVPVVGRIDPAHVLQPNPLEVDAAFEVPLSYLMDPANHLLGDRVFKGVRRRFYEIRFGSHYIWGVTAGIIRAMYEQVFG